MATTITGSLFDDALATTPAPDKLTALAGNDIVLISAFGDHVGDTLDGGLGYDQLWFTGGGTLPLLATVTGIESANIVDAVGNSNDTIAADINAGAVAALLPYFTLVGNDGINVLTGTKGADLIVGNGGADTINGGISEVWGSQFADAIRGNADRKARRRSDNKYHSAHLLARWKGA